METPESSTGNRKVYHEQGNGKLDGRKQPESADSGGGTPNGKQGLKKRTDHRMDNDILTTKGRVTVVLSDSMCKGLKSWEMRERVKQNVIVKSFSGATVEDARDYVRPWKRKNVSNFILHFGANDMASSKTAAEIATDIVDLALDVKTNENSVTVSELIVRGDGLNEKSQRVNACLEQFCRQVSLPLLKQSNLYYNHLNGSKIHLNKAGDDILTNNIEQYILY